ncbi:MAG: MFS transporter [Acidimicrobiales bacterium]
MRNRAGGLFVDLTPLKESRDYRFLFAGGAVSYLGRQITVVAVPFQVFQITGSSLAVGLTGLAALVPLVVMSLVGGAIADAVDRRRLLRATQVAQALTSLGLAFNAASPTPSLWVIYLLSALSAGVSGVELPTRTAIIPNLVRRELLPSAATLGQILFQVGLVAGPALAGLIISQVSLTAAYTVDVFTYVAAIATIALIRPLPPAGGGTPAGLASIREGLAYLRGRRLLVSTFAVDLNAMVFGMPRALFPALGTTLYAGGAGTVGLLYAAPGAGALVAALLGGWVAGVRRQGRAVLWSVVVWGAAIAAFGLVRWLPLGLVLLAVAGAADVFSAVFRNTILQVSVPDALRGRLSAVNIAVVTGGPRLGDAEAGAVAAITTPAVSVVSGGLACVLGAALIHRWMPELARYDAADTAGVADNGGPDTGVPDGEVGDPPTNERDPR